MSARIIETYDPGSCPRCGQEIGERPAANVDAVGVITCGCGMTAPVEWRSQERRAA